jgi:hypothetical protein
MRRIFFYLKLFMRILSIHSVIQSSTLCDLLQNIIVKVVKEFDISKQKGESYPDYPDRESRRTGAHLPCRCNARTIIISGAFRRRLRCRVRAGDSTCGCTRLQRCIRRRIRAYPIVIVNSSEDS